MATAANTTAVRISIQQIGISGSCREPREVCHPWIPSKIDYDVVIYIVDMRHGVLSVPTAIRNTIGMSVPAVGGEYRPSPRGQNKTRCHLFFCCLSCVLL
jgi:hypothetical protein